MKTVSEMCGQQCIGFNQPLKAKKVLFLPGMFSKNSLKPFYIQQCGFDVFVPTLSNWNFQGAVKAAQEAYNECKPDLIVGSSRGAAIAMNMDTGDTPLILLSPAWGMFKTKKESIVIHSKNDEMVPYSESVELCKNSGCFLLTAGEGHRLNDRQGILALAWALQKASAIWCK